ncbi:hypothetical protein BT69DRAFT_1317286, partial [Atractiella rhizophila]
MVFTDSSPRPKRVYPTPPRSPAKSRITPTYPAPASANFKKSTSFANSPREVRFDLFRVDQNGVSLYRLHEAKKALEAKSVLDYGKDDVVKTSTFEDDLRALGYPEGTREVVKPKSVKRSGKMGNRTPKKSFAPVHTQSHTSWAPERSPIRENHSTRVEIPPRVAIKQPLRTIAEMERALDLAAANSPKKILQLSLVSSPEMEEATLSISPMDSPRSTAVMPTATRESSPDSIVSHGSGKKKKRMISDEEWYKATAGPSSYVHFGDLDPRLRHQYFIDWDEWSDYGDEFEEESPEGTEATESTD